MISIASLIIDALKYYNVPINIPLSDEEMVSVIIAEADADLYVSLVDNGHEIELYVNCALGLKKYVWMCHDLADPQFNAVKIINEIVGIIKQNIPV